MAATSPNDLTTAGNLLEVTKNIYMPAMSDETQQENVLLNKIQTAVEGVELVGLNIVLAKQTAKTSGISLSRTIGNSSVLPTPGASSYDQMTLPLYKQYGAAQVPAIVMERMKSKDAAWVKPWDQEMKNLKASMADIIDAIMYGAGSGALATIVSFSASTDDTYTVDSTYGLKVGMVFDVLDLSDSYATKLVTAMTITSIDSETQFTVAGGTVTTGTPAAGDIITLKDTITATQTYATALTSGAFQGLEAIISTSGTFQGVARATNYWAQSNVIDNSGATANAPFYPVKMIQLLNQIKRRKKDAKTGGKVQFLLCQPDVASAIPWVLYPDRRFDNQKTIEIFDSGVRVQKLPVYEAEGCTKNTIYAIDPGDLIRGQIGGLIEPFIDPDGGGFIQLAQDGSGANVDAWICYFRHYGALAARRASGLGKLQYVSGLTDGGYGNTGGYTA